MAIEFVTTISDYNNKISKRMMHEIKYQIPTYLCNETLKGVFLLGKRNKLFDNQTYWLLN